VNSTRGSIDPIDSTSAVFRAGFFGDAVVQLNDSLGSFAVVTVTIMPEPVSVSPAAVSVARKGTQQFTASGGSKLGFTWSLEVNNSSGTINSGTGEYTAGDTGGVSDTVMVTDQLSASVPNGGSARAVVTVTGAVSSDPNRSGGCGGAPGGMMSLVILVLVGARGNRRPKT
jgi:hypothetical protein